MNWEQEKCEAGYPEQQRTYAMEDAKVEREEECYVNRIFNLLENLEKESSILMSRSGNIGGRPEPTCDEDMAKQQEPYNSAEAVIVRLNSLQTQLRAANRNLRNFIGE